MTGIPSALHDASRAPVGRADPASRAAEARFRHLADALPTVIWTAAPDGSVTFVSEQWHRYSGIDLRGAPGQAMHPDDRERTVEQWLAAVRAEVPYESEVRLRRRDGEYRWFLSRAVPVRDEAGHVEAWVGTMTDISERRHVEQECERLLAEVQWERSRLRELFETLPTFFALTRGPDHVYEFVNEAYYRLVGRRDLVGRRVDDVFPEGVDQAYPNVRERVLRDGVPFVGREVPLEIGATEGYPKEVRYLDLIFLPLTEADGTRSGIVMHGTDVTAHVHARREMERLLTESEAIARREHEARAAAERATLARDEVLRIISHELRTPLSVMKTAVDALLNDPVLSPANVHRGVDLVRRSAEWMERLLGDLLDAASIEAGRLALQREHETPRAILTHAAEMFEGAARQGDISLETYTAPDLPVVFADRARVLQALSNLVTNALKATGKGGHVLLRAERDRAGVRFSAEDSGAGIPAENLPHMFDRSWQQHHHTNPGLGLGLAIVRGIVEAHGGEVSVESALGRGSRFSFTIPLSDPLPHP